MSPLRSTYIRFHRGLFGRLRHLDGLPPLLLRLYLAPVMIAAGLHKFRTWEDMVAWFGNPEWGLGLPAPALMVALAAGAELGGGLALLIGFAVRWAAVPLLVSMAVAAGAVHWEHGWFAIAPADPDTSTAKVLAMAGIPAAQRSLENSVEVGKRLEAARNLLREHGNYQWLTEKGTFVVLNNGIEFAATYFIMLLSLFFTGGGRYFSIDYWLARRAGLAPR
ncbi:MAG: DoxX family protein [Pseudomonadota bacterium]